VNGFVQPLLPVVVALLHPATLEDIPDSLGKPAGPFTENEKRLPGIDHPLVVNPALPVGVDGPNVRVRLGRRGSQRWNGMPKSAKDAIEAPVAWR